MSERIKEIIEQYRTKRIEGKCIDLVPYSTKDNESIVELRNRPKNMYFLAQAGKLDLNSQNKWYEQYSRLNNDIFWCIYNKNQEFIGTIRIYKIDDEKDICTQGSFLIDEEKVDEAPYSLEAEIMSLDFAFDILNMAKVINEDRADNKVMNNLSKKIGFIFQKNTVVNGVDYKLYHLNRNDYLRSKDKFQKVIDYWSNRNV